MLYLVVEHFRDGDPVPVYRKLRHEGRGMPDGLRYVSSWITTDMTRCYQVMETDRRELLDEWMKFWGELVEFEVHGVMTSAEVQALLAPRL